MKNYIIKKTKLLAMISVLMLLSSCYSEKTLTSNSVSGRVILSGEGVAGVKLELDSTDKPVFTAFSDSQGEFEFDKMWSGEYVLTPVDSTCNFDIESVNIDINEKNSSGNVFEVILSWQRFFGNDNNFDSFELTDIFQTSDYGYLAVGNTDVGEDTRAFYWKFDQFGNLEWSKRLDDYDVNLGFGCMEYDSGSYVIAGNLDGTNKQDIFVKTVSSADGTVSASKVWSSDEDESITSLLFYGNRFYFPGMTTFLKGGTDGLIICAEFGAETLESRWNSQTDYDGQIINAGEEKIEVKKTNVYSNEVSGEGIVAVGLREKKKTLENGYEDLSSKIFISTYDFNGTVKYRNDSEIFSKYDEAKDVIQTAEGDFIAAAQIDNGEGTLKNILLVKYDYMLNIKETIRIGEEDDYRVCSIIDSGDGTFMILGSFAENGVHKVFLRKFDTDFNTLWIKRFDFSKDQDNVPVKIIKTKDGGYMIGGFFQHLGKSKCFLLKLNRQCEVLGCNIDTSIRDI